ncbi:MAG: fibronectin type III domain-containing protein [Bacteroidetes bacterium]|nr:fibronectin type III domain-containing protein [Bacteroidota bacterium]
MRTFLSAAFLATLFILCLTNCKKDEGLVQDFAVENIHEHESDEALGLRNCGADDVYQRMLATDPQFRMNQERIEQFTQEYLASDPVGDRAVKTIPVVVHVVWNTSQQNISDAQVLSQLTVLTNDFRRLNADKTNTPAAFLPVAADAEVEFCLATQDPVGNATTGIERRQTTVPSFSDNDAMKYYNQGGLNAWDASKYLNIWVCNLGGGILGYAQFPGGPGATDGVVITYTAYGTIGTAQPPFHLGRTATHEVGHWLNLFHIWGDDGNSCAGSDQVGDTPNQADENYSCPAFPAVSCSNGPNGDMFMNYMDYTDDACMNLYSQGQKTRMDALFASGGARYSLLSSPGCQPPSGGGCGTPGGLNATNITSSSATLNWSAVSGATAYNLQHKPASGQNWTTVSNLSGTSYNLTGLSASTAYEFKVQAVCGSNTGSYSSPATFTTLNSGGGGCTDIYEANNTKSAAKTIPVNLPITAKIGTATDKDWFKFNNTSTNKNIRITMTNLPFDYDVYLYRGNTLVGYSENPDTEDEEIVYNTNIVGTYYVKVIGYNGAYSNSLCYTLQANIRNTPFRLSGGVKPSGKVVSGR